MNWFKYRLPGEEEMVCGGSERLLKGFSEGFLIAPFINPEEGMITIPYDFVPSSSDMRPVASSLPSSTTQEDYFKEIEAIISCLGGNTGKTVGARVIHIDRPVDIHKTFDSLCEAYPNAFVFLFSTSETGVWIGATPELLLEKAGDYVNTMALAGTRPATEINPEWDTKNIEEQAMVADFIRNTLAATTCQTITGKTFTKNAGAIEHICTPISAFLDSYSDERIYRLLTQLSPTPAVCGTDRQRSLSIIEEYEHFDRELYGGFCGPNGIDRHTSFYVILRTAKCSDSGISVYTGGGITNLSFPEAEWKETEMKSKTIINHIIFSEK